MGAIAELLGGYRSLENPAVPLSGIMPNTDLWDALTGGGSSSSGERVNHKTALSLAAFWRGVNLIADSVAKLPLLIYRRSDDDGKQRDTKHPAFRLVRRRPNDYMRAIDFIKTLQSHVVTTGNGYAYIVRDGAGVPLDLLPLNPYTVTPTRINGALWYVLSLSGGLEETGKLRKLPGHDVLHIKGLGFDGLMGYDVISYHRETLGGAMARRKYSSVFFKNNATPNLVLEHPGHLNDTARENLRRSFNALHQGLDNQHKLAVLAEGMTARVLSVDARKSQLIELQDLDIRQIANILGVPPHKLGDPVRTSYNSLEQENQSFLDESLDGWLRQWEEECNAKLLTAQQVENDSHYFEFLRDALVRVDLTTQVNSLVTEVNNGLLNVDEARAIRNRPKLPNGEGQKFRKPANIEILGEDQDEAESETAVETEETGTASQRAESDSRTIEQKKAHRDLLVDVFLRMHNRVSIQARKAAKRPDKFIDWIDNQMDQDNREVFVRAVGPILRMIAMMSWSDAECDSNSCADMFFGELRDTLLAASECRPSDLTGDIRRWAEAATERTNRFSKRYVAEA